MHESFSTLVDLLGRRAQARSGDVLYRFLHTGDITGPIEEWSYGELDRRARAIAVRLREAGLEGERVLLLFAPGLEFIAAFFGALYAGAVAVPAYPPEPARLDRTLPRLSHIVVDSGARCVLSTTALCAMAAHVTGQAPALAALRWIAVDDPSDAEAARWTPPRSVTSESVAFLQYTSGATGAPKGVRITHGNVLHNEGLIFRAFEHDQASVGVSWLPMFHDMGLIGGVIQPLYGGFPVTLLSPLAFLHRPMRWLEAIAATRATTSGGPNFAYDLCARRVTEAELGRLDLGSWSLAFNGAEPTRAETLRRFAERFAGAGFRAEALYPCYGLAEATLLVTGGRKGRAPSTHPIEDAAGGRLAVSVGRPRDDMQVSVVRPDTGAPVPPGTVGEIVVAGPSVATGYWGRREDSERAFGGDGERRFLRTGDLGLLADGELYIAGRAKDLIIVRGRNVYPQDLEIAAEGAHAAVRPGCVAAFGVDDGGEEHVVVVAEVDGGADASAVAELIRGAVAEHHGVDPHAVVIVEPRSIPKTSSGKLQRGACRDAFRAGTLAARLVRTAPPPSTAGTAAVATSDAPRAALVTAALRGAIARRTGVAEDRIAGDASLPGLGLDSLGVVELAADLEAVLGIAVPPALLWAQPSVAGAAAAITAAWRAPAGDPPSAPAPDGDELSSGEQALWFECQRAPNAAAYNAATGIVIGEPLDVEALQRALGQLLERHAALRTTFVAVDGLPRRRVQQGLCLALTTIDAQGWTPDRLAARLEALVAQPFDLARGPLVRAAVLTRDADSLVVLVTHHLIGDHGSQQLCVRELHERYARDRAGGAPDSAPVPTSLTAHVARQRAMLASPEAEQLFAYWRARLAGCEPTLALPVDRPRPAARGYRAASHRFAIPAAASAQLRALCRAHGATPFSALLATFQLLLHRYTGQPDLVIGTPAECRTAADRATVGYFVNMLALRGQLAPDQPFAALLADTQRGVSDALVHRELPFDRLIERLALPRSASRAPLVQAAFVLHQRRGPDELGWQELVLDQPGSPFELTLTVVAGEDGDRAMLTYDPDLFDASSVERAAEHYVTLLGAAIARPHATAAELLSSIAAIPARPSAASPTARCLHHAFSAQAARTPDRVAVSCGEDQVTYAELDRRADRLARQLRAPGAGAEARIGLLVERSIESIVGVLGILKAGAAYVPLSSRLPTERVARLIADAGVTLAVTQRALASRLPAQVLPICLDDLAAAPERPEARIDPLPEVAADNLAYVIFTSGSTGRPKAVGVEHRQVAHLLDATAARFAFAASDVWTLCHSLSFDFSVWEIWGALLHGGRLVVVPHEVSRSPVELHRLLRRERVTVLNQVPSAFRLLVDAEHHGLVEGALALRLVIFGGEPIDRASIRGWAQRHGLADPALVNMYGITETTVHVTEHRLGAADVDGAPRQPIGRALPHLAIHLVGADGEPVAPGLPGEIYVAGAGVARGYLGNPAATAERFVPDPFGEPGARRYRAGDLARALPSGELEFLGRVDHQLQVRGHRVEPGEIESALRSHPAVRDAVVVAWDATDASDASDAAPGDAARTTRLLAYVETSGSPPGDAPTADELRGFLARLLPPHAVPSGFVILAALPRTPGGKPDRRALPPPPRSRAELDQPRAEPATELERAMAEVWRAVLELDAVGVEDDFFALGGDSIHSLQVVSRCKALAIELSIEQLFRWPQIRALCRQLSTTTVEAEVLAPFALVSDAVRARLPDDVTDAYPATMLQAVLIHQGETSGAYEVYVTSFLLRAAFDAAALRAALADLVRRHAMLRTSFERSPGRAPLQRVHRHAEIAVTCADLRALPARERDAQIDAWRDRERRQPFDWARAPLLRIHVHLCTEDTFLLSLSEPFLDGWSVASLMTELLERYHAHHTGRPVADAPAPASYAWLVRREREAIAAGRSYWADRVADLPDGDLPSPPARSRDPGAAHGGTRRHAIAIDAATVDQLLALGRAHAVPMKHLLLAAHLRVVALVCGTSDVVTGVMQNVRPEVAGADQVLGMFLNALPMAIDLAGHTGLSLARAALAWDTEILPHRFVPLAEIQRARADRPLFELAFNYTHFRVLRALDALDGIEVLDWQASDQTYFPLAAQLNHDSVTQTLRLALDYDVDRLDADLVAQIAGFYVRALERLVAAPDQPLVPRELLAADPARGTTADRVDWPGPPLVHRLFEHQVARTPDAVAAFDDVGAVSYQALDARANQLAHHLVAAGVTPGARVAIYLDRSVELLVALLGVLKAGAAYVPIDVAYPAARVGFMLDDALVRVVVTSAALAPRIAGAIRVIALDHERPLLDRLPATPLARPADERGDQLAYVLYTSGSTGTPKGVMGLHGGIVNRIRWMADRFPSAASDVACLKTSPGFVDAVWEAFGALCTGVPLAVVADEVARDPIALGEALARHRVTHLVVVPSLLETLLEVVPTPALAGIRFWISSGEALSRALAAAFAARLPSATLLNLYGSSEVAADVTWQLAAGPGVPLGDASWVPCGRAIANTQIRVLDRDLEPVPPGFVGDVYVAGAGLARGYFGRADRTADSFVPDPFGDEPGARIYATGDRGRLLPDGALELHGRRDHQIKIRGQRIELEEIALRLADHPDLARAACHAWREPGQDPRLIGYAVPHRGRAPGAGELRDHLARVLPSYMVPEDVVVLADLPLTPSGKLDRSRLPAPARELFSFEREIEAPTTPTEIAIAAMWTDLLGIDHIGVHDSFIQLGGHSLLATRLLARVRDAFEIRLPFRELLAHPTIAQLAAAIDRARSAGRTLAAPPPRVARDGALPLSVIQRSLWYQSELAPDSPVYNMPASIRLRGPLDVAALFDAIAGIRARHETLRTVIRVVHGQPRGELVEQPALPAIVDHSAVPEADRATTIAALARAEAQRPFALARECPLRVQLVRFDATDHALLVTVHHIAADGWSLGVLVHEITELYASAIERRPATLPAPALDYVDVAAAEAARLGSDALAPQRAYWARKLDGAPTRFTLPADRAAPAVRSFAGQAVSFTLAAAPSEAARRFGGERDATLFMVLLAAFEVVLHHRTGARDLVVGTDFAQRDHAALEGIVGVLVNQSALRVELDGQPSFGDIVDRVRTVVLEALDHQELPFATLVEARRDARDLGSTPLFQLKFVLQTAPMPAWAMPGLVVTPIPVDTGTAKFDVLFNVWDAPSGITGLVEYDTELFEAGTIRDLIADFELVIARVVAEPGARLAEIAGWITAARADHARREDLRSSARRREELRAIRPRAIAIDED